MTLLFRSLLLLATFLQAACGGNTCPNNQPSEAPTAESVSNAEKDIPKKELLSQAEKEKAQPENTQEHTPGLQTKLVASGENTLKTQETKPIKQKAEEATRVESVRGSELVVGSDGEVSRYLTNEEENKTTLSGKKADGDPNCKNDERFIGVPKSELVEEPTRPDAITHIQKQPQTNIYQRVKQATVYIENTFNSGSGVIIHPAGYIITNSHVIPHYRFSAICVTITGKGYKAKLIRRWKDKDLALLKVKNAAEQLPYL